MHTNPYDLLTSGGWDNNAKFAEACFNSQQETGRFLGTTFVARDMLRIVDALNEDGMLRFWGRSYSTVLGQTFAAMFPDRIDKMLIDSIVRPEDYWAGTWLTAVRSTETALRNFFSECINAGPEICPLANYTGSDTTPQTLVEALDGAIQKLLDDKTPIDEDYPLFPWQPPSWTLYHEFKYRLLTVLYRPQQFSAVLSITLKALADNITASDFVSPSQEMWNDGIHNFHGIGCSDSTLRVSKPEDMYSIIQAQTAEGTFGDVFPPQVWPCAQWGFDAAERYEGSFRNINTSFPILFVNGAYDPITPLENAWEASSGFQGSRFLVHGGHGVSKTARS